MMKLIPGGRYIIGTNGIDGVPTDYEGPAVTIELPSFEIEATTVTNQAFAEFVDSTGYVTEAEKFGWSFVFHYFLDEATKAASKIAPNLPWWYAVDGADWRHPEGPNSTILERMDHPVVQVSRNDAIAYCQWANKRLPNEAEWEVAAKGGTEYDKYPWGEDLLAEGRYHCNIWQGNFPLDNDLSDGFANTAPVETYEPNNYGCYQMIGNVWEWCSNPARIGLREFLETSADDFWVQHQSVNDDTYAMRGGSFLCHQSYCKRYRIAARNGNTGMSASNNIGFRCAKSVIVI